ncbi:hypothetical protein [Bradyrhizobium amphicarpaeae]|uniref:hypothetical protein n=1 Tax=Bradyrhizobium amphicarpaeae TaxID=1404768 RepID=UPI0011E4D427|nr:hypothetical protein [Bradyrhizobium amphicarpaeae]
MKQFHSLALAAAVSALVVVSTAMPAAADQEGERSVASSSFGRHHPLQAGRRATAGIPQPTRLAAIPAGVPCGGWCGREFVLMLGIGF